MALRAFKSNPSIGGFGGEYASSRLGGDADALSSSRVKVTVGGSCDAFAQIVKELVDNAVDACAPFEDTTNTIGIEGANRERTMKRVRVTITSATGPVARDNDNDNGSSVSVSESCLRIEVSDNGCGMADIDYCVSAFSSNKNWMASNVESQKTKKATKRKLLLSNVKNANNEKMVKGGYENHKTSTSDGNDNYTSGRYGVGLTLCLLHAQRLVPGTGACVTSATASASEWTRAIYEPDTDADAIVCKKKDKFPKVVGESGTTISLLVPGGEDARTAWPRLAEYFARFQLTTDLPCSLEVKATTLQSMPLYILPSNEIGRRMDRSHDRVVEHSTTENEWDGGDGFNDIHSIESAPKISKAAQLRAGVEAQKKEKISLLRKAAAAYKQRQDLKLENVAYSIQPIRRTSTGSRQSASSKDGPVLEMSLIVFGPELEDIDNQSDKSDSECYPRGRNESKKMNSAELQVVRMVNGIPLLDSSEALACGIVNKVSSNSDTWNCFGLCVTRKNDQGTEPLTELNTPTFEVNDSAQVAPFLTTSSHSLFYDQSKDFEHSNSSEDDDFDTGNRKSKRKKERQVPCHLPAAVRLGHILMIIQIRAKPSALPLPTLSKGRLPLNDKGINDALENGLADCLRSLQQSNPELLLTAQQLKKVERDMKYVPAVTGAIASVLGRSLRTSVNDNAMDITSRWDDGEKAMRLKYGMELRTVPIMGRARAGTTIRSNAEDERAKVETLRSALERRLRFIVSDELKDAAKNDEKEQQKKAREEFASSRKKIKKLASDDMKGDCFDSKDSDESSLGGSTNHLHRNPRIEISAGRQESGGSDGSMTQSVLHSQQAQAALGMTSCNALSNKGLNAYVGSPLLNIGQKCWKRSSVNSDFDDGYESSPTRVGVWKVAETDIQTSQTKFIEESRKSTVERPNKTSYADDAMSSSSEWSSQYGEVVAGYFFR